MLFGEQQLHTFKTGMVSMNSHPIAPVCARGTQFDANSLFFVAHCVRGKSLIKSLFGCFVLFLILATV